MENMIGVGDEMEHDLNINHESSFYNKWLIKEEIPESIKEAIPESEPEYTSPELEHYYSPEAP